MNQALYAHMNNKRKMKKKKKETETWVKLVGLGEAGLDGGQRASTSRLFIPIGLALTKMICAL
jgi:hypothetical protein